MSELLNAITLRQFRSYPEASFEFDEGVNIVIGPNAVGKTNLLEAVHIVCFGKGFRAKSDAESLQHSSEWARIDAAFGNQTRVVKLEKSGDSRLKKQFEIGGRKTARLLFEDMIPVVLFEPDALRLTNGGPERRRDYIDTLLAKLTATYRTDLLAYERVLRQRNTLLKSQRQSDDQLFVWDVQLVEYGTKINEQRRKIVNDLNEHLSEIYSTVAGTNQQITISYQSSLPESGYATTYMKRLAAGRQLDFARGFTGTGPHRDDVVLKINGRPMKDAASRGENRTLLLALKILELTEIERRHGKKPLLLLDDVFSELDGSRRKLLTGYLKNYQTIITTTDADVVGKKFTELAHIITLS